MDQHEVEKQRSQEGAGSGEAMDLYLDPVKEKKLLARLDLFFVPIIMLVYLSCFLDRTNIGALISLRPMNRKTDQRQAM